MDKTFIKVMQECGISLIDDAECQKMMDEAIRLHIEFFYNKEAAIAAAIYYKRAMDKLQAKLHDSKFIFEETNMDKQLLSYLNNEQRTSLLNILEVKVQEFVKKTQDKGIFINDVKWATRNVYISGIFAENPEDIGAFYQWNRKIGWFFANRQIVNSDGEYIDNWDTTIPIGSIWEQTNDPSPNGWRIPTADEINKLLDSEKVLSELASQNDVEGKKFTDKITGNSIFLPEAGYLEYVGEVFNQLNNQSYLEVKHKLQSHCGCYWSGTTNNSVSSYGLFFNCHGAQQENIPFKRGCALPIRCVANKL